MSKTMEKQAIGWIWPIIMQTPDPWNRKICVGRGGCWYRNLIDNVQYVDWEKISVNVLLKTKQDTMPKEKQLKDL